MDIRKMFLEREQKTIELRRKLHMWPEYGDQLPKTQKLVCEELDRIGISYICNHGDSGVIADISGGKPGKTILFRADMDALHLQEEADLDFRSQNPGYMHACGHDAHVAMLLTAAEVLYELRDQLHGTVRLVFEAGEEIGTGGIHTKEAGGLEGVDAVFALHVGNLAGGSVPSGVFSIVPGPVTAGKDRITLTVHGKSCHGAYPQDGVDALRIAARIVTALEDLMEHELPQGMAAVMTFGCMEAGKDNNTIPDLAVLHGTIRTQSTEDRQWILQRLESVCKEIPARYGGSCEVVVKKGSNPVRNDPELSAFVADSVAKIVGPECVQRTFSRPSMGSDDFAWYTAEAPGVYYFLSTSDAGTVTDEPQHSPKFRIEESALWKGAASLAAVACDYLQFGR